MEQFYTILTDIGKAKIANATALQTKVQFTKVLVGDSNGSYYEPTESQTKLKNKVWEGGIGNISIDKDNPNWIVLESVIPSSVGGFTIREVGIEDNEGDLVVIAKYPQTYKPKISDGSTKDLIIKTILEVTNVENVTLKVDPTIILATKKDMEVLENKIDNIKVPVTSVNSKTGEVELNTEDIKTSRKKTIEQELTDTRTVLLNLTNNKLNESTFNKFKQNTESQLENTKGTISSYYPIINVSTRYERQVSASKNSSAEGIWSQVIASDDCHAKFYKDVIIGSRNCIAKGKYSNAGAIILASDGIETTDASYIVCGGYHRGDSSMKNKKWEINSKEGTIKATGAITGNSTLADFAEYFESIDRKAISAGTIVTLDGDKIRPCKENEEMLGVISETAGVLLNACGFHWQDRYQRNEFGGLIYKKIYDEESKQYITVPRENQEHDMKEEYIAREDREEWNVVGLTGQVYVRIDNTIQVGDFITSNNFGIATKDNNPTYVRWKVMKITTPYNEEKGYGVALVFIR
ncbi:hypothetical protein DP144_10720 [Clostridium tetani]|uniref:peptidase G2 autoproteolytic cleavage domain-containing protein n=1 Tax=Clostridium tetani TaxID=1513 RepID=UPI00101EB753|nr:peptidase G2 autoproteolytic cleavage domain-containing protein [Clostridium tetani]RYU98487.1 hypothetical protein DP144_10720 [Clostridium tetani]